MSELDLTDSQRDALEHLPNPTSEIADALGITNDAARKRLKRVTHAKCDENGEWHWDGPQPLNDLFEDATGPDLETIPVEGEPDENDLTPREEYILHELREGRTFSGLVDELNSRPRIVSQHLRELKRNGWQVYHDDTAGHYAVADDAHTLRSSEHKGTRTRKANRWWEQRHTQLVRDYKSLPEPTADDAYEPDGADWILCVSDIHAGDKVYTPDKTQVYGRDTIPRIVDYITERSLTKHDQQERNCEHAVLAWDGDFLTNSGIYQGQFEDLDAWLDEQHEMLLEPLLRQLKAYSNAFQSVRVVCQVGNHGEHRANGTSQQANADLILYKSIRNTVAAIRDHAPDDTLSNVDFQISEVRPYVNFPLRGGRLRGHLRHGQDRKPQAVTRAGHDEWSTTYSTHDFDVALMGHHHISGRIPWDGPPVIVNGSPKPPGDFVDKIAGAVSLDPRELAREVASCVVVDDSGVVRSEPVRTTDFEYTTP